MLHLRLRTPRVARVVGGVVVYELNVLLVPEVYLAISIVKTREERLLPGLRAIQACFRYS